MVSIAHPGESAGDADGYGEVRNDSHDEYRIVVVLMVDEN